MAKQGRFNFLTQAYRSKGGKPKNFSDTFEKQAAMPNVMERYYRQQAEDNFPDKPEKLKNRWVDMKLREYNNKLKKHTEEHAKIVAWLQEQSGKEYTPPAPDNGDYEHYANPEESQQWKDEKLFRVKPRVIGELHPRDRTPHSKGTV